MSQKYKYKGVDLTDLFYSQSGTISTSYGYTNFPNFQKSSDAHKIYDSTNHGLFKSFASTTPGYTSSTMIGHTTIAKEVILKTGNTSTTVPTWAKAVKFDIQNINGDTGDTSTTKGSQGAKGSTGAGGSNGPNNGSVCFYSGCWTNYQYYGGPGGWGGSGGAGGEGGQGGDGGAGGAGGEGGTSRISTIIELSETNRNIVFEPTVSGALNANRITMYDKYNQQTVLSLYKGKKGAKGGNGYNGGTGAQGAKGHQGGGGYGCQFEHGGKSGRNGGRGVQGSTGATGAPGYTGSKGAQGAKGAQGDVAAVFQNVNTGAWQNLPNVYRATTSDNVNQAKLYYFID